jgi:hypothetical protein
MRTVLTLAQYYTTAAGCGGLKGGPPTLASEMLAVMDMSVHTVNAVLGPAAAGDPPGTLLISYFITSY